MQCNEKVTKESKIFFNLWAYIYDYFPIKPWFLYIQKGMIKNIRLKDNLKILDIGCGTGDALLEISKKSNAQLYGLDISKGMLKRAKKKLKGRALLKQGNIETTGFKRNTFDYILSTEAFHHFPNPEKALREMYRILKKNGELLITDVNFNSSLIHRLFKILEPGHVNIYSKEEFKMLFEKNKFSVLEQKRMGWFAIATIGKKQ